MIDNNDAAIEESILFARADLLYENANTSNFTVTLTAILLMAIFLGEIPTLNLILWLVWLLFFVMFRVVLTMLRSSNKENSLSTMLWVRLYIGATFGIGLGWMMLVIMGFALSEFSRMVVSVIAVGVIGSGIPMLAAFPIAVQIYCAPALIALCVLSFRAGGVENTLFAVGVVSLAVLLLYAEKNLSNLLTRSLEQRFQNINLAAKLKEEKEKEVALNRKLGKEIDERTLAQKKLKEHGDSLESEVQKRTLELKFAKEEAEAGNKVKSDFLATMSHEIRTPMNVVLGMTELLKNSGLSGEQKSYVEAAYVSGQNLLEIINNILDFSKIEAKKLHLKKVPFSLENLVHNTVNTLALEANDENINVLYDFSQELAPMMYGDSQRLRQVLVNLIGNAIKFTDKGEVSLRVYKQGERKREVLVGFEVRDEGIGIPEDKLEHIFEYFTQEDSSATRRFGGTGLGLAISEQFILLMGGNISVESEVGKGSSFQFTIPLELLSTLDLVDLKSEGSVTKKEQAPQDSLTLRDKSVLLAEDNEMNQELLLAMLGMSKVKIDVANNGFDAVNMASEKDYDLILMDCHMPIMGGLEATKLIRQRELEEGRVPTVIIALTADIQGELREECFAVGMNGFLSKPYDRSQLIGILEKSLV